MKLSYEDFCNQLVLIKLDDGDVPEFPLDLILPEPTTTNVIIQDINDKTKVININRHKE